MGIVTTHVGSGPASSPLYVCTFMVKDFRDNVTSCLRIARTEEGRAISLKPLATCEPEHNSSKPGGLC